MEPGIPHQLNISRASETDCEAVASILAEAAAWAADNLLPIWPSHTISATAISTDVGEGFYYLGYLDGVAVATMRLTPDDPETWPDATEGDALYLHRLAVRRSHAGGDVSKAMLRHGVVLARNRGCRYLRLDCDRARPRLRAFYEGFGFIYCSDQTIGPYTVARYQLGV